LADLVKPPLRLSRRGTLLLACLAAMSPVLASSAGPASSAIPGPRRSIGVRPFDAAQSFASAGGADAAGLVEAALIARLEATGCCKVVERDAIAPLSVPSGERRPGERLPAQFIIAGSVTLNPPPDFGYHFEDSAPGRSRGSVEIEVRLSDTRTSMVLGAFQAERRLSANQSADRGGAVGARSRTDAFFASPLGQATDLALADIVAQIAVALAALP
jgi:curli biogenesis system outer membrane secretion channel CsgG